MNMFWVQRQEIHTRKVLVIADTVEEARHKAYRDIVVDEQQSQEHSIGCGYDSWPVEECKS